MDEVNASQKSMNLICTHDIHSFSCGHSSTERKAASPGRLAHTFYSRVTTVEGRTDEEIKA